MKKRNIGSTVDSWLREEGIHEEVTASALKRVAARRNASATAQKGLAGSKTAMTCKSMKVRELIGRLREFEPEAEVRLRLGSRNFAPPGWVGIMDTAGLFDEGKNLQLVISPWEPEEYLKPEIDPAAEEQKKLRAREAARRLADMGGTMPELPPIPRRRQMPPARKPARTASK